MYNTTNNYNCTIQLHVCNKATLLEDVVEGLANNKF